MKALDERVIRLRRVGQELYGRDWKGKLAPDLDVSRHTLINWDQGVHPPPDDLELRLLKVLTAVRQEHLDALARIQELGEALGRVVRKQQGRIR